LYLFYSNRRPEDAPFLEPLQKLDGDAALQEKVGRRDVGSTKKCCRDLLSNLQGPIYYIAGPPAMVTGMRKMLVRSSIDEDDIRTEKFAGY